MAVLVLDDTLDPGVFAKESRILFHAPEALNDPAFPHVVLSGSIGNIDISAPGTDILPTFTTVHLVVGPWWGQLRKVVAHVSIGEYYSTNPDQDDFMRWGISDLTFTKRAGEIGGQNAGETRIQLEFVVTLQGSHSNVLALNYYVTAMGRSLGHGGLESP